MIPIEVSDHRLPSGATVVTPCMCANCSRRLYSEVQGNRLCPSCAQIFELGAQVWVCVGCGTARKYGDGRPDDTSAKELKCCRCCSTTTHEFFEVCRGVRH